MGQHAYDLTRLGVSSLLEARFMDLSLGRGVVAAIDGWSDESVAVDVEEFITAKIAVASRAVSGSFAAWLIEELASVTVYVAEWGGAWSAYFAGDDEEAVRAAVEEWSLVLPNSLYEEDGRVAVTFWSMGPMGPFSYTRRLDVAPWETVACNYPAAERLDLARLMAMSEPRSAGRLILWTGPPGTGKTHGIRALADSWREWCDFDYVVDADQFFGSAAYMVQTLVMRQSDDDERWRLVIIEDAGEFLTAGAHERTGQGLSRLLNLSDGLVGQGLRLLILMTTNEPADELHPAVVRPGRCLAALRFGLFSPEEATEWMRANEIESPPEFDSDVTLAELYAALGPLRSAQLAASSAIARRLQARH